MKAIRSILAALTFAGLIPLLGCNQDSDQAGQPATAPAQTPTPVQETTPAPPPPTATPAPVTDYVAGGHYAASSRGSPTFLDLGGKYPHQKFTVVIWGSDRSKFLQPPEEMYLGKTISVTGRAEDYKGRPEIVVRSPAQITIVQ